MFRQKIALCFIFTLSIALSGCGSTPSIASSDAEEVSAPIRVADTFYPAWNASDIYTLGDIVVHNGRYFRALWWTQGNEPRSDVERDEWQDLGNVPAQDSPYFSDVSNEAWYASAVNALAAEGIVDGAANGINFQASRPITRAQFALWLCRALNIAPAEGGDNFSDAGNDAYTPYLAALKQAGIAKGDEAGLFHPSDYITRQALCRLLYDACDGFAEDPPTTFAPYADADDVPQWAIQPISWCIDRGLIQGRGNRLLPDASVSRAEAAQALYNLLYGTNTAQQ